MSKAPYSHAEMNTSAFPTMHAKVGVAVAFAKFIATFESLLGKYDPTVADQIRSDPPDRRPHAAGHGGRRQFSSSRV